MKLQNFVTFENYYWCNLIVSRTVWVEPLKIVLFMLKNAEKVLLLKSIIQLI